MTMQRVVYLSLMLAVGSVASAAEQSSRIVEKPLTKEEARFRALDRDNDRKLSDQEFRVDATSQTEFAMLDTDSDGALSMSEFVARPIPPAKAPPAADPEK